MDTDHNTYIVLQPSQLIKPSNQILDRVIGIGVYKKRRSKKKLCMCKTLKRYYNRIKNGPLWNDLNELNGVYLSTFKTYSTTTTSISVPPHNMTNAHVLMKLCKEKGVNVKGVTSQCKMNGRYISDILNDPDQKVLYIDKYNFFTRHKDSKWTISKEDKVYTDE